MCIHIFVEPLEFHPGVSFTSWCTSVALHLEFAKLHTSDATPWAMQDGRRRLVQLRAASCKARLHFAVECLAKACVQFAKPKLHIFDAVFGPNAAAGGGNSKQNHFCGWSLSQKYKDVKMRIVNESTHS